MNERKNVNSKVNNKNKKPSKGKTASKKEAQLKKEAELRRERRRAKKIRKLGLVIFAVYIVVLCFVTVATFALGKKSTKKRVSIYKEQIEAAKKNTEKQTEVTTEEAYEEEVYGMTLTKPVSTEVYSDGDNLYNGEDLKDNGHTYAIKVNRQENVTTVYTLDDKGYYTVPVKCMICATAGDDNTIAGTFEMSFKIDWALLLGGVYGQYATQITDDILFHSVPYVSDDYDQLETWEFNKLGTASSMGCVRLCVADVKWIYENCDEGTLVNIFDSDYLGPWGKPSLPYKIEDVTEPGWDPTDMREGNPYAGEAVIYGAENRVLEVGDPYNEKAGIIAFDSYMNNVTDELDITGKVDVYEPGEYKIKYSYGYGDDHVEKEISVTVIGETETKITKAPKEICLRWDGYTADGLNQLIADYLEYEGADMVECSTDEITGPGKYLITCKVKSSLNNKEDSVNIDIIVEE